MITCRPLDPETDWCFFVPDYPVPADCLAQIRPIAEESARELWCHFIDSKARHPMMLPDDAWPARLCSSPVSAHWQADWNDETATTFNNWLNTTLPWPRELPVIFTWSSSQSVETSWEVFSRCWRNFLFDDEGSFLWSLQRTEAIVFTPCGLAHAGNRSSPTTVPN
ncbi:DUF2947 family protein [Verrucomicrobiota bacterium sgz303538]